MGGKVAYADFLQLFDCFEDCHAMGGVGEFGRQRGAQAGEAGADDDEVYPLVICDVFAHCAGCGMCVRCAADN